MKQHTAYEKGLHRALNAGNIAISGLLLQYYKKLNMTELDMMLVIHLQYFREHEQKEFPTWEELQARMTAPHEQIVQSVQRLIKQQLIRIEDARDEVTGVHYECYDLSPLYAKLVSVIEEYGGDSTIEKDKTTHAVTLPARQEKSIFTAFEHELARPLSPMECETITSWIEEDQYSDELILLALKEAVFAGKVHLNYIDRILLEWDKNRIRTVQQAKDYASRFRGGRR